MRQILIVEDDRKASQLLTVFLEKHQYNVTATHDGRSFQTEFDRQAENLSLVVVDVMLPDTDGFALCKMIRRRSNVPIVILTASSDETDRIVGLELGADDYVAKPYNPRELLARIKAIHRRMGIDGEGAPRYYYFAGFTLDLLNRTLSDSQETPVLLTGLDYQLMRFFLEHPGVVLNRNQLYEYTRGRDAGPLDRSLEVQLGKLRTRLDEFGNQKDLIKTVRGAGYVFTAHVSIVTA